MEKHWVPDGADIPTPLSSVAWPLPDNSGAGLGAGVGVIRDSVLMTRSRANATRGSAADPSAESTATTTWAASADGTFQHKAPVAVPLGGIAGANSSA